MGHAVDKFLTQARERFPERSIEPDPLFPAALVIPVNFILEFFEWLKTEPSLNFDYFEFSTVNDRPPEHMDLIYSVYSLEFKHRLCVKVTIPRENPTAPSLSHLWKNADWNEREIIDLFGVFFQSHPDPRRLMMPDDWEGHPLRKDYMHPNLIKRPD